VCELVAGIVLTYVESNATLSEIETKLDSVCNGLPSPYNGECTLVVNIYLPQIVQWVENNEPADMVCQQLNLCSSEDAPKQEEKREIEQSVCAVCEVVVQVAEHYLLNNATDKQIEAKLDALCANLPAPYNGECTLIVSAYLPQILTWLKNNEDPEQVCAQLSLCSSKKNVAVKSGPLLVKSAPAKREAAQSVCAVCELVVQVAEKYLLNNATDKQIEAKLDALCANLPAPYNGECTLVVSAYLPQILTWLKNNEDPEQLCSQLSLCSKKEVPVKSAPRVKSGPLLVENKSEKSAPVKREAAQSVCAVCELVVQVAEKYLLSNATDKQIEAKLDALCANLPAPYNGECTLVVSAYLPQILTWLKNNEDPEQLCSQLSLCSSKKNVAVKREVEQSPCALCNMVVQIAEAYVDNNATIAQIEAKLDDVCTHLPSPYNTQCAAMVKSYLPQVVTWLKKNEKPDAVCVKLNLCTN